MFSLSFPIAMAVILKPVLLANLMARWPCANHEYCDNIACPCAAVAKAFVVVILARTIDPTSVTS
jgi:hypothetical protein